MATDIEYINYKEFVAGLSDAETPDETDKAVVCNETDGPRATPLNAKTLTTAADETDLNENSSIDIYTANGRKRLPGNAIAKASEGTSKIHNITDTATEADLVSGNYLAINGIAWTKKLPGNVIAPKSVQDKHTSNFAPTFVPNSTNAIAGHPYIYDGSLYRAKVDYNGVWDASKFESIDLSGASTLIFTSNSEYVYAVTDSEGRFLFGCRTDGTFEWASGIPSVLKKTITGLQSDVTGLQSDVTGLQTKTDNVSASIAPEYDGTTGAVAGLPYMHDGNLFICKENTSGPWDSSKFKSTDLSGASTLVFTSNSEYIYAVTDSEGRFLFGCRRDGTFDWASGIPSVLKKIISDINDALLGKVDKETGKSLIDSVAAAARTHDSNDVYMKMLTDSEDKVVEAINNNGQHVFFCKPIFHNGVSWTEENISDLKKALKNAGILEGTGEWSEKDAIEISKPRCAIVNFTGTTSMPTTKTEDMECTVEFWDMKGNYFKKPAVINAQGNSSLVFEKKNISIDLLNKDESSFSLKIGDWVAQDSFHLKAYYTDFFRGMGAVGYDVFKLIANSLPYSKNRTWKKAIVTEQRDYGVGYNMPSENALRIDDGALCFPQGFPCVVYLDGAFYGVFAWQLKKHRDNYMMNKDNTSHIHLDGVLGDEFFSGTIDWTAFEIRNPKGLKDMDGNKYDGDDPKEIQEGPVKTAIENLSGRYDEIHAAGDTASKKALFEQYFDVDNIIDYIIFCDLTYNYDGYRKNWQWTTWDGVKWYVNPYDLDGIFGLTFEGQNTFLPKNTHTGIGNTKCPSHWVYGYYQDELNARYAYLRSNGILTPEKFIEILDSWVKAVGNDNYKKEWRRWPNSPCNRDIVVNTDYWSVVVDENGDPVVSTSDSSPYSADTTYAVDDEVTYNPSSYKNIYYKLKCVAPCSGQVPITSGGMRDSIWRVNNWIEQTFENMDTLYGYSS